MNSASVVFDSNQIFQSALSKVVIDSSSLIEDYLDHNIGKNVNRWTVFDVAILVDGIAVVVAVNLEIFGIERDSIANLWISIFLLESFLETKIVHVFLHQNRLEIPNVSYVLLIDVIFLILVVLQED